MPDALDQVRWSDPMAEEVHPDATDTLAIDDPIDVDDPIESGSKGAAWSSAQRSPAPGASDRGRSAVTSR